MEKKVSADVVKKVNDNVRMGLGLFADALIIAEADRWAYRLRYSAQDLMNASFLFQHIASNIGIKAGHIDEAKAVEFGERLRQLVIDITGIDPHEVMGERADA